MTMTAKTPLTDDERAELDALRAARDTTAPIQPEDAATPQGPESYNWLADGTIVRSTDVVSHIDGLRVVARYPVEEV
jgi:hypothetical protein